MSFIVAQAITGLASAASLFLIAVGLSIVFGVTRVVNFAHGSLYMLGAYIAFTLVSVMGGSFAGYLAAFVLSALAVGAIGALMETTFLRRIYRAPELFQLLATFGVVLIIQDLTRIVWGADDLFAPRMPGLDGAINVLGHQLPEYDLFLIAVAFLVLGGLWLLFRRTRFGVLVRAATEDREMVSALGIDQRWLFTAAFVLGAALAGLGGALQIPRQAASLSMDLSIIVDAFVVVVVGGMGSIMGAFVAAVLISMLLAFGLVIFPEITLVLIFLVMAVTLVLKPSGLFGRPEFTTEEDRRSPDLPLRASDGLLRIFWWGLLLVALAAPVLLGEFAVIVLTEIAILALFAASLHFLLWGGGLITFGHAAYFGLGAYGAGLAVFHLSLGMEPALLLAPLAGAAGAVLFGWFCVRLSGIYMAMLTLAFAQITWSAAFQWIGFTGGDNGILGVWPSAWASSPVAFYYLTLAVCAAGIWGLRHVVFSPFGYTLRATRDSAVRSAAIGIDVTHHRWLAFTLAGAAAGIAGGFFAFAKGSVFPDVLFVSTSVDGLVMVLLGGVQSLAGPVLGAIVFTEIETELNRLTELWQLLLGVLIVALVVFLPNGLAGLVRAVRRRPA
ncbi:MAG: ABC transporter permease [Alphaproteobacteria bacterium]|nr:ABC transporter permease [Alphaproteobacteria bacterium]